jgi:hypothetical protein
MLAFWIDSNNSNIVATEKLFTSSCQLKSEGDRLGKKHRLSVFCIRRSILNLKIGCGFLSDLMNAVPLHSVLFCLWINQINDPTIRNEFETLWKWTNSYRIVSIIEYPSDSFSKLSRVDEQWWTSNSRVVRTTIHSLLQFHILLLISPPFNQRETYFNVKNQFEFSCSDWPKKMIPFVIKEIRTIWFNVKLLEVFNSCFSWVHL